MYYKLNENAATGTLDIVSFDAKRQETLILSVAPPEPMDKVFVKDAAEFASAAIANHPRVPLKDRLAEAAAILEHRWKLWAENPEWRIHGGIWMNWLNSG